MDETFSLPRVVWGGVDELVGLAEACERTDGSGVWVVTDGAGYETLGDEDDVRAHFEAVLGGEEAHLLMDAHGVDVMLGEEYVGGVAPLPQSHVWLREVHDGMALELLGVSPAVMEEVEVRVREDTAFFSLQPVACVLGYAELSGVSDAEARMLVRVMSAGGGLGRKRLSELSALGVVPGEMDEGVEEVLLTLLEDSFGGEQDLVQLVETARLV